MYRNRELAAAVDSVDVDCVAASLEASPPSEQAVEVSASSKAAAAASSRFRYIALLQWGRSAM